MYLNKIIMLKNNTNKDGTWFKFNNLLSLEVSSELVKNKQLNRLYYANHNDHDIHYTQRQSIYTLFLN